MRNRDVPSAEDGGSSGCHQDDIAGCRAVFLQHRQRDAVHFLNAVVEPLDASGYAAAPCIRTRSASSRA